MVLNEIRNCISQELEIRLFKIALENEDTANSIVV